ncbi:MAG: SusC/RagA family TonB-linked outer membrane protein [Bacteroidales bacterium]|nr:SusC/RagA family TonB-linked outer membrane protein [Candidatus Cryptobacteroides caccocaballi]
MLKKIALALIALVGAAVMVSAQNKQISGKVTDANGDPVPGASVMLRGTTTGTVTGVDGTYVLSAAASDVLEFTFFGMKSQSVVVGDHAVINVTMQDDAMALDEVVVTALGITKSEKSLGYSATTVKSDDLTATRGSNAVASVAGKVAGVQISSSATTAGAQASVVIRGFSSIGNSNQPLYVIDGVPMQSLTIYNTAAGYGNLGAGVGSINNDDIESMTILKGAAATALYGSRAAGGVILINTKSGKNKVRTEIEVNAGMQFSSVSTLPEFQNKFGTGWDGNLTLDENGSWGPAFNDQFRVYGPVVDNSQMAKNYAAVPNNIRNFYDTGVQYNTSVSVSGGSDRTTYFTSFSKIHDDGILPRNKDTYDKNTFSFRGSHQAKEWLKFDASLNFTTQRTDQVSQGSGQQSILEGLYQAGRDISFIDAQDLSSVFNRPEGWFTPYGITNPYWIIDNSYNRTDLKKIFGKVQVEVKPIKQLTFTYRYGLDYTDYDGKNTMYQIAMDPSYTNSSSTNQEGSVSATYGRYHETNHDFLANFNDRYFDNRFEVNATIGANINERGSTSLRAGVTGLTFDTGFWDLSNTSSLPTASESQSLRRSIGLFGDLQLGWDDQVYLNVTARNDWSSTLPKANNHYFYPGATLSWIFTNTFNINKVLSFGKLRLAYGKTGNDPNAYLTNAVFVQGYAAGYLGSDLGFPFNGYNAYMAQSSLASGNLSPEMTSEFEVGANLQFFNGRIGIDAAYYDRTSDMQIFKLPSDPATGYSTMVINFGKVRNNGVELLLTTVPVKTRDFEWDLDINWAKNYNKVVSLPEGLDGGKSQLVSYDDVAIFAEQGKPLGTIYTTLPIKTDDGKIVVGEDGLPLQSTDKLETGLNIQNKWTGGINTSISYKGFTVSAAFDVRYGGYMYSRTKTLLWFTGNSIENTYNDRRAFVVPNSVVQLADGSYAENNTPITLYESTYQYYMNGNNSYPIDGGLCKLVERTYAKLRELSISYNLPEKWVSAMKLQGVRLSAVGNNLFTWTPKSNCYIDPDQGYTTDLNGSYGEINCTVPCRYMGFNIQVKF